MPLSADEQVETVSEHRIDVAGTSTHYFEYGSGPSVLLLHGAGGNAGYWLRTLEGLGGTHRAVAVDLPGYGETESLGDRNDPGETVAFLWRFAEVTGLGRPVLLGHSLGGFLAVLMALDRPEAVRGMVLISAGGLGRAINPGAVLQATTPLGDLVPLLAYLPLGPELLVAAVAVVGARRPWRLPSWWWSYQLRTASSYRALKTTLQSYRALVTWRGQKLLVLDRLSELPVPALVVWGAQDRMVPFWQGAAAARRLPRGELRLLPCSGHLSPNESETAFLRLVRAWLPTADRHDRDDGGDGAATA